MIKSFIPFNEKVSSKYLLQLSFSKHFSRFRIAVNQLITDLIGGEAKDVRFSIWIRMELDGATTSQVSKFQQVTAHDFYVLYLANTYTCTYNIIVSTFLTIFDQLGNLVSMFTK